MYITTCGRFALARLFARRTKATVGTKAALAQRAVLSGAPRVEYIDGLRAIAALVVLVSHTLGHYGSPPKGLNGYVLVPHFAVDLFIVLSGYCLMLPVLRRGMGSVTDFYRRRALRIYPAYLASVAIGALLFVLEGGRITGWDVIRHALMIVDWREDWNRFNGVVWTVCVEVHCYILFPLLVALWDKLRYWSVFIVATAAVPLGFLVAGGPQFRTCPQYLLLFVMGMTAAVINRNPSRSIWFPLLAFVGIFAGHAATYSQGYIHGIYKSWAYADLLVGAACACLLVAVAARPAIERCLSVRPLVWIGSFSYSLYLVHVLVIRSAKFTPASEIASTWGAFWLVIGASITAAYAFALVFERRYVKPIRLSSPAATEGRAST